MAIGYDTLDTLRKKDDDVADSGLANLPKKRHNDSCMGSLVANYDGSERRALGHIR